MESKSDILDVLGIVSVDEHADGARIDCMWLYLSELKADALMKDTDRLHLIVKKYIETLQVSRPSVTRQQCLEQLKSMFTEQDRLQLGEAIDISLRIWSMIDVRDDSVTGYPRRWREEETIEEMV
jgi:hypothetical protein